MAPPCPAPKILQPSKTHTVLTGNGYHDLRFSILGRALRSSHSLGAGWGCVQAAEGGDNDFTSFAVAYHSPRPASPSPHKQRSAQQTNALPTAQPDAPRSDSDSGEPRALHDPDESRVDFSQSYRS